MLSAFYVEADPIIGDIPLGIFPILRNMSIMVEIMEGAIYSRLVKSVVHLAMIIQSMKPKRANKRII